MSAPETCHPGFLRYIDVGQFTAMLKLARTTEEGSRQLIFAPIGPNPNELDSGLDTSKGAYVSSYEIEPVGAWVWDEEGVDVQCRIWRKTWDILL